ncbi:hypothetical protein EV424DRAFT_184487 [Suillus variegatus]|nr:hypothetical protein EV424DRAFT_184487 [Suillus variegatus]
MSLLIHALVLGTTRCTWHYPTIRFQTLSARILLTWPMTRLLILSSSTSLKHNSLAFSTACRLHRITLPLMFRCTARLWLTQHWACMLKVKPFASYHFFPPHQHSGSSDTSVHH